MAISWIFLLGKLRVYQGSFVLHAMIRHGFPAIILISPLVFPGLQADCME
jgi:hypothetical protein